MQECRMEMPVEPPVWLQLMKHCGQFSECHPSIFDSMGQQLAAQQKQIGELQEQQCHMLELKEELAATRAQAAADAAASQAAAATAAAEAGELRQRLQAIEGQVQQLLQPMLHPRG